MKLKHGDGPPCGIFAGVGSPVGICGGLIPGGDTGGLRVRGVKGLTVTLTPRVNPSSGTAMGPPAVSSPAMGPPAVSSPAWIPPSVSAAAVSSLIGIHGGGG